MEIFGYKESFKKFILPFSSTFGVKNKDLEVICISKNILPQLGLRQSEDSLGFNDSEVKSPSAAQAPAFQMQDKIALNSTAPVIFLNIAHYLDKIHLITSVKMSFAGEYITINAFPLNEHKSSLLISSGALFIPTGQTTVPLKSYRVLRTFPDLSERESIILFHLIRGRSANTIGTLLHRSKRTIEDHIRNIKSKLNCASTPQLIEHSLFFSYDTYIPLAFITKP